MNQNPFTSDVFTSIWLKHFNDGNPGLAVPCFSNLLFIKHRLLPLYYNVGKTHTKGISYTLASAGSGTSSNEVFLIYDIPTYFNLKVDCGNLGLKCHKVIQYPGFLTELEGFRDLNQFMTATFGKRTNGKFKRYQDRLEVCFDIRHKMFRGEMTSEEYDFIFMHFKRLLEKRFSEKKITNNNLEPKEWNFYKEVVLPMIRSNKAGLFVTYDEETPIAIALLYFSEDTLFDAIPVFDIDHKKFNLGTVTIMQLVEWCLKNNIKALDFSKGYYEYKTRWAKRKYNFEYHMYYNPKSIVSTTLAFLIKQFFCLKQFFREKKLNELLHKVTYFLMNRKETDATDNLNYELQDTLAHYELNTLVKINFKEGKDRWLTPIVFDFLYLNSEKLKDSNVYQIMGTPSNYLITGRSKSQLLIIKDRP